MLNAPYLWHPIFVHLTIGLLSAAVLFYVLAAARRGSRWRSGWIAAGEWNLWAGVLISVVTLLAGWLAYNTVDHDDASHTIMESHAILALITIGWFSLVALLATRQRKTERYPSAVFTGLMIVGFALLIVTGWRGGELVYGQGLAVSTQAKSLPAANASGRRRKRLKTARPLKSPRPVSTITRTIVTSIEPVSRTRQGVRGSVVALLKRTAR